MKTKIIPNIFQAEALKEIKRTMLYKQSGIVVMPTGTGKTFLSVLWFKKQLEQNPKSNLLFICHNKDIISQANEQEFQKGLKQFNIEYGYYNATEKKVCQTTFATVQTLKRNLNKFKSDAFDFIIVDEAHHYQAHTFKKVINHFKPKFKLGLTATPHRMDKLNITEILGDIIYKQDTRTAINKKLLSPIKSYCIDNDIDCSTIKWNGTKYDETDLNRKVCVTGYDHAILKEYKNNIILKHDRKKTICFCVSVEHCTRMSALFNKNNISAKALTGNVKKDKRKEIINEFRNNKYSIIFVRDLFNEGIDIPDADCVMFLRPTQSHTIFTQQIGRGLRNAPNKQYLLALDFIGNSKKCSINYEVLGDFIGQDIIKKVCKQKPDQENISEDNIEVIDNGCTINLSRQKIDILRSENYNITKQDLIDEYYQLKTRLSKQPICTDMDIFGKYNMGMYYRKFGTWNKFLESINEQLLRPRNLRKKDLIDGYYQLKTQLGKQPTVMAMSKHGKYNISTYYKHFGTWNKFLESINEPVLVNSNIPKQDLIDDYYKVKKELNKQPTYTDMNKSGKYGVYQYYKHFGSWNKFLESINEPILRKNKMDN